ncbi:MAG: long-chain fatty acid--CoA ligase [Candidatus Nanopelagicales bacterium]
MSTIYKAREELPQGHASFTAMLIHRIASTPDRTAFQFPNDDGGWNSLTWAEVGEDATVLAAGLIALGIKSEQRVAIAGDTSMNWILADLAISLAGGAVTTVYASTGAEDVAFILSDSNSHILFAENEVQLQKVLEQRQNLPELHKVVLFNGPGDGEFSLTLDDLRALGREALGANPNLVQDRAASVQPDHLATLIYTSGTTGKPKGVEIVQSSWGYCGQALRAIGVMSEDDVQLLWLPMAHVFGTVLLTCQVEIGFSTAVDGRVPKIMENCAVIKPTFMGAVPRIFEKVHAAITAMARAGGPEKEQGLAWGVSVGTKYHQAQMDGNAPDEALSAEFAQADELVLSTIRGVLGGNVRFFISGSAPLAADISEFFAAAGMPVLEGYGLTETSAITTICRPDTRRGGYVGEPQPGTEVMIADDGEILVRSPAVMRRYRNRPDATEEVLLPDGWFATGDIGEFDEFDRLKITDRKKDLFKTSGGKYVAPSAIESQFKALCGVASNMVVHADGRKFVSAIITLDPDAAAAWATAQGKPTDLATLSEDPDMQAYIQASIDKLNEKLNHWENVQKFVILDRDLSIESGELTPSLKVKRKVVEAHNKELLDSLYS